MPTEAWYLLIVSVALAVLVALWKGRRLIVRRDSVEVTGEEQHRAVSVADGLHVKDHSKIGDIVGVDADGSPLPGTHPHSVEVMKQGRVEGDAQAGDIIGTRMTRSKGDK